MVEEIHMLETKGVTTEARQHHQTSSKNDQLASASEGSNNQPKSDNQPAHRFGGAHASHSHAILLLNPSLSNSTFFPVAKP